MRKELKNKIILDLKNYTNITEEKLILLDSTIERIVDDLLNLNKKEAPWLEEKSMLILRYKYNIICAEQVTDKNLAEYLKYPLWKKNELDRFAYEQMILRILTSLANENRISTLEILPNYKELKKQPVTILGYNLNGKSYHNLLLHGINNLGQYLSYSKEEIVNFGGIYPINEKNILDNMRKLNVKFMDDLSIYEIFDLINGQSIEKILNSSPYLVKDFSRICINLRYDHIWITNVRELIVYLTSKNIKNLYRYENNVFISLVMLGLYHPRYLNKLNTYNNAIEQNNKETSIAYLKLSDKLISCMIRNNIYTLEDLLSYHSSELKQLPCDFKDYMIDDLKEQLTKLNLRFLDDLTGLEKISILEKSNIDVIGNSSPYWLNVSIIYIRRMQKENIINPTFNQYYNYVFSHIYEINEETMNILKKLGYRLPYFGRNIKEFVEYFNLAFNDNSLNIDSILNKALSEIIYDVKMINALKQEKIETVKDILIIDEEQLSKIRNIGPKRLGILLYLRENVIYELNKKNFNVEDDENKKSKHI